MADDGFEFTTYPPQVQFATTGVPPPSPAYVGPDDLLEWLYPSSVAGVLFLDLRILLPTGQLLPMHYEVTLKNDRVPYYQYIRVPECFILSAVMSTSTAAIKTGCCLGRLILNRGGPTQSTRGQLLMMGYVVYAFGLTWPWGRYSDPITGRGRLRRITGTNPAPGSAPREVVPTGARWRLITVHVQLVTSAAVADRRVSLFLDDGALSFFNGEARLAQTASTTLDYSWAAGLENTATGALLYVNQPLPGDLWLPAGFGLTTGCINLQAADDFSAPDLFVEEWIEP